MTCLLDASDIVNKLCLYIEIVINVRHNSPEQKVQEAFRQHSQGFSTSEMGKRGFPIFDIRVVIRHMETI